MNPSRANSIVLGNMYTVFNEGGEVEGGGGGGGGGELRCG